MPQNTQLDRIEKKIDRMSLIGWLFGGFALFVGGMVFIKDYEAFSFMWFYSLIIALVGCLILIVVFFAWIKKSKALK